MKIQRHFTAHSINMVVNDPSVFDWVRGVGTARLDVTPALQNHSNVLLMGEYGGVLFLKHQPGVYEAHTQVLPAGRGQWTLDMVNEALKWMFTSTDCVDIMTRVPKGNLAARALAKAIHGRCEFRVEKGWVKNDQIIPVDVFSLRIQDWMATAPGLEQYGEDFHDKLVEEYTKMGKDVPNIHPDDPVHDRYVGAAFLMVGNGQPHKGVLFYNRWAGIAGYAPISVVSDDPVVIDIQESLLAAKDGSFYVLRVK